MKILKALAATVVLLAPIVLESAPAQAITANQYTAQGHGRYVSSKHRGGAGRGYMHHRYHRHYRHHR